MVHARTVHVKICGVRTAADASRCVELGVDSIGLNFVASSPRFVDVKAARDVARVARARASKMPGGAGIVIVGVVADLTLSAMRALLRDAELDRLQLHGEETNDVLEALLPCAYKAVRIASGADVERARAYGGDLLLVDTKVDGRLGGSGRAFDWSLVEELARDRAILLAGGLDPHNVARAIRQLRPYGVDVAGGVESVPGSKDPEKIRAFIEAVRFASRP